MGGGGGGGGERDIQCLLRDNNNYNSNEIFIQCQYPLRSKALNKNNKIITITEKILKKASNLKTKIKMAKKL